MRKEVVMRYVWSRFFVMVLSIEGVVFIVNYHFGSSGVQTLHRLKDAKKILQSDIAQLQVENNLLQEQIDEWSSGLFFQEKYAREKLHMQKAEEKIYFSRRCQGYGGLK